MDWRQKWQHKNSFCPSLTTWNSPFSVSAVNADHRPHGREHKRRAVGDSRVVVIVVSLDSERGCDRGQEQRAQHVSETLEQREDSMIHLLKTASTMVLEAITPLAPLELVLRLALVQDQMVLEAITPLGSLELSVRHVPGIEQRVPTEQPATGSQDWIVDGLSARGRLCLLGAQNAHDQEDKHPAHDVSEEPEVPVPEDDQDGLREQQCRHEDANERQDVDQVVTATADDCRHECVPFRGGCESL
jgi:hypothetical protein